MEGITCNVCNKYIVLPTFWGGTGNPPKCNCSSSVKSSNNFEIEVLKKLERIITQLEDLNRKL